MTQDQNWRWPDHAPTWRDGIWYIEMTTGKPELVRWKPSINWLCDRLWGGRTWVEEVQDYREIHIPTRERIQLFETGLDCIRIFRDTRDLLELARYRRQVSELLGIREIDVPFFQLMCEADPPLTAHEWGMIAQRMPAESPIRVRCDVCAQTLAEHEARVQVIAAAE